MGVGVPGPTKSLAQGLAGRLLTLARATWWSEGVDTLNLRALRLSPTQALGP